MKIKIYILSSIAILFSSCADWLDVTPNDTVVETELFKEATGYRNALNGVYKQISFPEMYGREMTWGFIDVMSLYYDGLSSYSGYAKASKNYNYIDEEVKPYLVNIWEISYNSIANCNNILGRIEKESPSKFPEGKSEIDLIIGETLALRAFLHFDILRLFAPSTKNDDGKAYIPYFEKYPSHGESKLTNNEIKNKIIRDLVKARDLVAQFDTLNRAHIIWIDKDFRFLPNAGSSSQAKDIFFAYRGYRMSYPAITAILARVYNYFGMHDEAVKEAEKIINMEFPETEWSGKLFSFAERYDIEEDADVLLTDDLIFALSFPLMHENFRPHTDDLNDNVFSIADCESLFDDEADIRLLTTQSTDGYTFFSLKNMGKQGRSYNIVKDMVPMIRASEMYYIVAESYAAKGDFSMAQEELDKVRIGRGCKKGQLNIADMDSFVEELINEARREFISEGQLYYYYKKYNVMISKKMKPENFVFPLPESQNVNF